MKLKKTMILTLAAMAVCASAFANVMVKDYDVNEDWVKMQVPQVKGAGPAVDAKINNALNFNALMQLYTPLSHGNKSKNIMRSSFDKNFEGPKGVKDARKFVEDVGSVANYALHTDWNEAKILGGSMVASYGLDGKYSVLYNSDRLLCVEQKGYIFTGGAHGNTLYSVSAFDLSTGRELQLADLFQTGSDYLKRINKAVAEQVAQRSDMFFGPVEVKDGDKFYFDGKALVIVYVPYEVAPYAAGIVRLEVPADGLADILVY